MIKNWEKWVICNYFTSKGPGEAGEMEWQESFGIKQKRVLNPVLGEEQPLAPAEAEIHLESNFAETAQADHRPIMCSCRREDQRHPGLHEAECCQRDKGGVPGVPGLALGSPEKEGYRATGGDPAKMIKGSDIWEKAEESGIVHLSCTNTQPWGMRKSRALLSSDKWLDKKQWAKTEIMKIQFKHKKTPFTVR